MGRGGNIAIRLGSVFIVLGFGSVILYEFTGVNFRLMSWADSMQPVAGCVVGGIGVLLLAIPLFIRLGTRNKASVQPGFQSAYGQSPQFGQPQGFGGAPQQFGQPQPYGQAPQQFQPQQGFGQPQGGQPAFGQQHGGQQQPAQQPAFGQQHSGQQPGQPQPGQGFGQPQGGQHGGQPQQQFGQQPQYGPGQQFGQPQQPYGQQPPNFGPGQ